MASNKNPNGTPDANEFGQQNAYLAQQGMSQEQRFEAIGGNPSGRSREEINNGLKEWMREESKEE